MSQLRYNLQILDTPWAGGNGSGFGVNDFGEVVGYVANTLDSGGPASWMPGQPHAPILPFGSAEPAGNLLNVDDFGNAVGETQSSTTGTFSYFIVNGTALIADLSSLGIPSDINNNATVIGTPGTGPFGSTYGPRSYIYTFLPIPGSTIWLSPLPNSAGILANAINDLGDVVGGCDNGAGFFYSASTKKMTGIDSCLLYDINVNRLAVGQSVSGQPNTDQPIVVDLSKAAPVVQSFLPPKPFVGATALAVNSSNTIVGFCNSQNEINRCAFVYYSGDGTAFDLNTVLGAPTPYYLMDAMDINESGQIVGTATLGPVDQPTDFYAYIATPYELPSPPLGPVRSWPFPIWVWPWGWLPNPGIPPSSFGPSPLLRLAAQISRIPITGKRRDLQKMLSAHRARIARPTPGKKPGHRKNKKR